MGKPQTPPDQAVDEAVALLRTGNEAPSEDELRRIIRREIEHAKLAGQSADLSRKHRDALLSVQKDASQLLRSLEVLRALGPWAESPEASWQADDEKGATYIGSDPIPMTDILPVDDLQQLEDELKSLEALGEPASANTERTIEGMPRWKTENGPWGPIENLPSTLGEPYHQGELPAIEGIHRWALKRGPWAGQTVELFLSTRKQRRARMPPAIIALHRSAYYLLTRCGIQPATGTGANIAELGSYLCTAAECHLAVGESTKAARIAASPHEWVKYQVTLRGHEPHAEETEKQPLCLELGGAYCRVLPKLKSN